MLMYTHVVYRHESKGGQGAIPPPVDFGEYLFYDET